jgi:hypothetical protein
MSDPDVAEDTAPGGSWYYCLEARHPGAREVIDESRFFLFDGDGCAECPACGRQVSAVPSAAKGVYPAGILAVAERLV